MGKRKASCRALLCGIAFSVTIPWACAPPAPQAGAGPLREDPASAGFLARRSWPSARLHLTRAEIRSSGHFFQLFEKLERIRIDRSPPEGLGIEEIDPVTGAGCQVHLYINGRKIHRTHSGMRITLDDILPTRALDGLEYHVAPDGPILEEDGCGTLLVWSEELRTRHDRVLLGGIEGRVKRSGSDPILRVELGGGDRWRTPAPDGSFSFSGLLPGEYHLLFRAGSGTVARVKLRVYAFRESRIDLEIGRRSGMGSG